MSHFPDKALIYLCHFVVVSLESVVMSSGCFLIDNTATEDVTCPSSLRLGEHTRYLLPGSTCEKGSLSSTVKAEVKKDFSLAPVSLSFRHVRIFLLETATLLNLIIFFYFLFINLHSSFKKITKEWG